MRVVTSLEQYGHITSMGLLIRGRSSHYLESHSNSGDFSSSESMRLDECERRERSNKQEQLVHFKPSPT